MNKDMILHFKDTFKIRNSSKTQITDIIISELKYTNVDFIDTNDNNISFKYKDFKVESYFQTLSYVDKGIFKLKSYDDFIEVIYESSISQIFNIILVVIFFILGLMFKYFFLIGSFAFIIEILIKIHAVRVGNKVLIRKITSHFS